MGEPFPRTQENNQLRITLNRNPNLQGLEQHLRFINTVSAGRNGTELVLFVEDSNGIGTVIENCLQQPHPGTVDVYFGQGQTGKLQLARDPNGSRYVFSGPLNATIINCRNGEIRLWGYHNQANGVFVLTGVSRPNGGTNLCPCF